VAAAGQGTESPETAQQRLAGIVTVLQPGAVAAGAPGPGTNQQEHGHDRNAQDRE
jgi:hypothetical protein